jgi:Right handed beta helix region
MMVSQKYAGVAIKSVIFGGIFRASAKLRFAVVVVAAVLPAAPSHAEHFLFVSAAGSGSTCSATVPCASVAVALFNNPSPYRVICLNGSGADNTALNFGTGGLAMDIDCPQGLVSSLTFSAANATVRMQHLGFRNGAGSGSELFFTGSGTLILEDCVFTDTTGPAIDIEPNGSLNVVIKNCRISNSGAGIIIKPAAGGSVKATLDHVTITGNGGGGIKIDTTNAAVTVDITDSVISSNAGNGINAVGGAGGQNMLSIKNSVIAKNGSAGVQANGANAGVMIATTLLDQNAAGALAVLNGGNVLTYGNNSIVGLQGSNFTGTAALK